LEQLKHEPLTGWAQQTARRRTGAGDTGAMENAMPMEVAKAIEQLGGFKGPKGLGGASGWRWLQQLTGETQGPGSDGRMGGNSAGHG
jgi:hypothetical protein